MTRRVSFAQLEQVLTELGFTKRVVPEKGVAYDHVDRGLMLVVKPHKANEKVSGLVLAYIRQQLEVFGIIEREEFEGMLQAVAA